MVLANPSQIILTGKYLFIAGIIKCYKISPVNPLKLDIEGRRDSVDYFNILRIAVGVYVVESCLNFRFKCPEFLAGKVLYEKLGVVFK